jgi:hypothetical protein
VSDLVTADRLSPERRTARRLAVPFPVEAIRFKPQAVSGARALPVPYISARHVMDRLDEVVGPSAWQDEFFVLASGDVTCRLSVRLGAEWVTKQDVGSQSEQPDDGDKMKAGFSDALKRSAVKFGIGRYLYTGRPLPWADFDPKTKKFVNDPPVQLPPEFHPCPEDLWPADGQECATRLLLRDRELAKVGRGKENDLVASVRTAVRAAGHGDVITAWGPAEIELAMAAAKLYVKGLPAKGAK